MRAVFLTVSGPGPIDRIQNAYEMWAFNGSDVEQSVLRGWFANGGGPADLVRLDWPDDLAAALEAMPDAEVVCFPGLAELGKTQDAQYWLDAQRQVVAACERRGSIAVLDCPPGLTPQQARSWRSYELRTSSPNAVLYYPWIRVDDEWVPPCGHVAGAWARVTRDEGVAASVGGLELIDVVDVATYVTPIEQWLLQQVGISLLRALPGWGIRTAGARTLSSEPWLFRVSTVRLLAALKPEVTQLGDRLNDELDIEDRYELSSALRDKIRSLSGQPGDAAEIRFDVLSSSRWRVRIELDERITAGDPLTLVLDHPAGTWSVTGREPEQDGQRQDR